jgi:hypothetical protein
MSVCPKCGQVLPAAKPTQVERVATLIGSWLRGGPGVPSYAMPMSELRRRVAARDRDAVQGAVGLLVERELAQIDQQGRVVELTRKGIATIPERWGAS